MRERAMIQQHRKDISRERGDFNDKRTLEERAKQSQCREINAY